LDEILCVVRLPKELRRSLACTNIIENMNGTIRQVTRNVKRWRDGFALDRCWHDGSQERLPTVDGLQAAADAQSRPAGSSSGTLGNPHQ
jgi:hypothetical protein